MATIPINDQYRISSDKRSWMVQEKRTRKVGCYWESVSWYSSLEQALKGLGERLVRESSAQTLAELLEVAENVSSVLRHALTQKHNAIERLEIQLPYEKLIKEVENG